MGCARGMSWSVVTGRSSSFGLSREAVDVEFLHMRHRHDDIGVDCGTTAVGDCT